MVYVDPKNLGYDPFWKKWVNTRNSKQERDWLAQLYDKYVPSCIEMIIEGVVDGKQGEKMKTITPLTNLNLVSSWLYLPGCLVCLLSNHGSMLFNILFSKT